MLGKYVDQLTVDQRKDDMRSRIFVQSDEKIQEEYTDWKAMDYSKQGNFIEKKVRIVADFGTLQG